MFENWEKCQIIYMIWGIDTIFLVICYLELNSVWKLLRTNTLLKLFEELTLYIDIYLEIYAYINGNLYKLMEQYAAQEMKVSFLSLIYLKKIVSFQYILHFSFHLWSVILPNMHVSLSSENWENYWRPCRRVGIDVDVIIHIKEEMFSGE